MTTQTTLITGASDGIGAIYANRLARKGHNLILVARRADRLEQIASELRARDGVEVEVLAADLADAQGLASVETRLRSDAAITGLINNAGIAGEGPLAEADTGTLVTMLDLNIRAVTLLSAAVAGRFAAKGAGTIVNVSSVTALMPTAFAPVYPASKAYVLAFSESLAAELQPKGVRVQVVLPGITRTPIWDEELLATLDPEMVMDADDMVDAALAGLEAGEIITIPSLPDGPDLDRFLAARDTLGPNLSLRRPAHRYYD